MGCACDKARRQSYDLHNGDASANGDEIGKLQNDSHSGEDWSYDENDDKGPLHWSTAFPVANGKRQSPIDIQIAHTTFDPTVSATNLVLENGHQPLRVRMVHDGHTMALHPTAAAGASTNQETSGEFGVTGGCLGGKRYVFAQCVAHWGTGDANGTEHAVDGRRGTLELQAMFWNSADYSSYADALDYNGAVLALAVLFAESHVASNASLRELADCVATNDAAGGSTSEREITLDVRKLFPESLDRYWQYDGSLTSPPCYETIRWIVFEEKLDVDEDVMRKLREYQMNALETGHQRTPITCRPLQSLNNRDIYYIDNRMRAI